jgi:hypothetical protein
MDARASQGATMSDGSTGGGKKLAVYAINEKDGERAAWWQRIGVAFQNRDGSVTLYLDALPLGTNKLQVREARDEGARQAAANGAAPRREPPVREVLP